MSVSSTYPSASTNNSYVAIPVYLYDLASKACLPEVFRKPRRTRMCVGSVRITLCAFAEDFWQTGLACSELSQPGISYNYINILQKVYFLC